MWSLFRTLCTNFNDPVYVLIGCDYNEILSYDEKEGGADSERHCMTGFRDVLQEFNLHDLRYEGQWYTWERGRSAGNLVRKRLDRYCGNETWVSLFPEATVEHLVRYKSDHTPILMRDKKVKKERFRERNHSQV